MNVVTHIGLPDWLKRRIVYKLNRPREAAGQMLNWGEAPENYATLAFVAAVAVVLILSFLC